MCESNAWLKSDDGEKMIMRDVMKLTPLPDGKLRLETILGDMQEIEGTIIEIDFESHKIIIEKK